MIFGGIYSTTRQAIKGPAVVKGRKLYILYIYLEQYQGQESDPDCNRAVTIKIRRAALT